jgi:hypothetical protein
LGLVIARVSSIGVGLPSASFTRSSTSSTSFPTTNANLTNTHGSGLQTEDILREDEEDFNKVVALQLQLK